MSSLRLSGVCFSYADPIDVLTDVSLHFEPGWTAIVGENGGGKTTLLRLLSGELEPTAGHVRRDPANASVILCPQRVEDRTPAIDELAWAWDRAAIGWRDRLLLEPDDLDRWPSLSPGERKRWQVGAALWRDPDVLLLDEPTNHLDAAARDAITRALSRFRGIGALVSHDRGALDALATATVRVAGGAAERFRGDYTAARRRWEHEAGERRRAHADAQRQRKSLARRLADERRHRAAAEAKISARSRMKSTRDSDARSVGARIRVAKGEARAGRKVAILRGAVERADADVAARSIERARAGRLFVDYERAPQRRLIRLDVPRLTAGERVLARELHVVVERDSRVIVSGPNGGGKTTLLREMLATLRDRTGIPDDRVLYLPQELSREDASALVRRLGSLDRVERGRVLQVAAALGLDPVRVLATDQPSPGEARKLAIAYGLGRQVWLVLLDEPTNHLDLPSIERLEAALAEFPGALVLASHDRAFTEAVAGGERIDIRLAGS